MVECNITVGEQSCTKTLSSYRDALVCNSFSPDMRMINMSHHDDRFSWWKWGLCSRDNHCTFIFITDKRWNEVKNATVAVYQFIFTLAFLRANRKLETYPLLDKLEGSLVLWHLQQLHGSPLIWSKPAHFTDHVTHKLAVLGQTLQWNNKMWYEIYIFSNVL